MDIKILVGSIIAIVILVGVSFTSVVGYSIVKSTTGKESPLFDIRANRAIGEESKVLTGNYVGKGNALTITKKDGSEVLTRIIIDNIRMMDDKTFEKSIAFLIDYMQKDKRFNRFNSNEITEALYLIRNSDESISIFWINTGNTTFGYGFKGFFGFTLSESFCIIKLIIGLIGGFILWCANPAFTTIVTCPTMFDCPKTIRRLF